VLARDFGVGHVTLELEITGGECAGSSCDLPPDQLRENDHRAGHSGHAGHTH
jgi:hypothetical protein